MSASVWMLLYDIADSNRDTYLKWFHEVHVPEKLARPGYTWAAHYRVVDPAPRGDGARGYIALFGGEETRTFYDPSPSQLKQRQDERTREMMGYRSGTRAVVLCEEWRSEGAAAAVGADAIRLTGFDAENRDEDLCAWLVQERGPGVDAAGGALRKWLGSSGSPRHVVVEEYASMDGCVEASAALTSSDRGRRILEQVEEPAGPPRLATRIWPQPEAHHDS